MIGSIARLLGVSDVLVWVGAAVTASGLLLGALALMRADAVQDYREKVLKERLEDREEAKERENEIEDLDDRGLADRLRKLLGD